jgi:hypothetical protein
MGVGPSPTRNEARRIAANSSCPICSAGGHRCEEQRRLYGAAARQVTAQMMDVATMTLPVIRLIAVRPHSGWRAKPALVRLSVR